MLARSVANAASCLKERILCATKGDFDQGAVLLFSGGRDSSAVAGTFAKAFPEGELHLIVIDNGVLSSTGPAESQSALITQLFPEVKITLAIKKASSLMARAGIQQIERDFAVRGYKTLLICAACKLVMSAVAAQYAKERGISVILDGYALRQQDYPEQTECYIEFVRGYYRQVGLISLSPLYDVLTSKEAVNELLLELGISTLKQEGKCMFGDSFSTASEQDIRKFVIERMPLIERLLEEQNG